MTDVMTHEPYSVIIVWFTAGVNEPVGESRAALAGGDVAHTLMLSSPCGALGRLGLQLTVYQPPLQNIRVRP